MYDQSCMFLPADRKPRSRNLGFCHGEVFGGVGWGGLGTVTFLALAHIFDATQQDVSL